MKKNLIFLLPVIFVSCASFRVPVPGETAVRKNNIFVEYMNIADSYNDLGKYDKAITYYKMAKSNRKLKWTANYKLARAYAMNKNWEEAQKLYLELYMYIAKFGMANSELDFLLHNKYTVVVEG